MAFELLDTHFELDVTQGSVTFNGYEALLADAERLNELIKTVKVDNENIKDSKKMVAEIRKKMDLLEAERKNVKKTMLEPYTEFENQVKTIGAVVKEAEEFVRGQIRELDEYERQERELAVKTLFEQHAKQYEFYGLFSYKDFLKPQHLNKSTSPVKVETELVEWLTEVEAGIEAIKNLDHADEVLAEYQNTLNLTTAMNIVSQRHKQVEAIQKKVEQSPEPKAEYKYQIFDKADAAVVEAYMDAKNINYKKL